MIVSLERSAAAKTRQASSNVPDGYFSGSRVEYRAGGAMPVGNGLEKHRPKLVVDGHIVMRGKVVKPLRRIDICFRQDVFHAHSLEENRIEPFLGKSGKPLPVPGKGSGEPVLRRNIHAAYFTIFSSQKPFPGVLFRIRGFF